MQGRERTQPAPGAAAASWHIKLLGRLWLPASNHKRTRRCCRVAGGRGKPASPPATAHASGGGQLPASAKQRPAQRHVLTHGRTRGGERGGGRRGAAADAACRPQRRARSLCARFWQVQLLMFLSMILRLRCKMCRSSRHLGIHAARHASTSASHGCVAVAPLVSPLPACSPLQA